MAQPYGQKQGKSGSPVLQISHDFSVPYAQAMGKTESFGFGERLKSARVGAGMTGLELGVGAGESGKNASKQSVSDWEAERHYPKADQLRVICLKLNINVDYLIFGDIKERLNVIQAESAIKALTDEQRQELLRRMNGAASPNERVGQFIKPAPPHELDTDFGSLPPEKAKSYPKSKIRPHHPATDERSEEKKKGR